MVLPRVFDISVALSLNGFLHTFCGVVLARSCPIFWLLSAQSPESSRNHLLFPTLQSLRGPVQGQNRVFPVYSRVWNKRSPLNKHSPLENLAKRISLAPFFTLYYEVRKKAVAPGKKSKN